MAAEYLDPLINWPTLEDEGAMVEASFTSPEGEGYIRGALVKVDEITGEKEIRGTVLKRDGIDEDDVELTTGVPLFHIVTMGCEVCWHDVTSYRFVA